MKAAWSWMKTRGTALFGGLAGLLFLILGSGWLWHRYKGKLGKAKDAVAIAEATKNIARLEGERKIVAERVGEKDDAIDFLDTSLMENKRRIVEAHEGGENLTDEEMLAEFAHLGI